MFHEVSLLVLWIWMIDVPLKPCSQYVLIFFHAAVRGRASMPEGGRKSNRWLIEEAVCVVRVLRIHEAVEVEVAGLVLLFLSGLRFIIES